MITINSQLRDLSSGISTLLDQLLRLQEEVEMMQEMAEDLFPDSVN